MNLAIILSQIMLIACLKVCDETFQDNTGQIFGTNWSYKNQASWSGNCSLKQNQSPINLQVEQTQLEPQEIIGLQYVPRSMDNTNNNFQISLSDQYAVKLLSTNANLTVFKNGQNLIYNLQTIEFHFPAENLINNYRYDGEIQLQFTLSSSQCKSSQNRIAIVSVPIQSSGDNGPTPNLINKVASILKSQKSGTVTGDIYQDLLQNLTSNEVTYLNFQGSFTSPYILEFFYQQKYANVRLIQASIIVKGVKIKFQMKQIKQTFWWTNDYKNHSKTPQGDLVSQAAIWAASISSFLFLLILIVIKPIKLQFK